jgi:flagellar biosynthesis protein FlhB
MANQEKTEKATGKKRRDARKKGQTGASREIPSMAVLLCALTVFYFSGAWMFNHLSAVMRMVFDQMYQRNFNIETTHMFFWEIAQRIALILSPLLLAVMVAGVVSNVS